MVIFKYELRQLRSYTIWWSIAAAVSIFMMLPVYLSFMTSDIIDVSSIGAATDLFETFGFDIGVLMTPIGTLGFLTSFLSIAAGVNGMFLGLKTFTKETVQKSAEFIYTKPYRRSVIFRAKVAAALIAAVIIGVFYYVGAMASAIINVAGGFDFALASLVAASFMLTGVSLLLLGSFVGAIYSKIRTPLLVSAGAAFILYVLSSFANKINAAAIKYLTPYAWFNAGKIIGEGRPDAGYMAAFAAFCVFFAVGGYFAFIKRDVEFIA
jgi:ABC-2 type transport system permease protein